MKRLYLLAVTATMVFGSQALAVDLPKPTPPSEMPAGEYKNDIDHTNIKWMWDHMLLAKGTATFHEVDATLNYDPKDPTKSKVVVKIDPKSVLSTSKRFNGLMLTHENWFQPEKHPEITFVSTKIEKTGDNKGVMYGDLTIKGITKTVKLDAEFLLAYKERPVNNLPTMGFKAKGTVKRSEFDLGAAAKFVPDEIDVIIDIEFNQGGNY